MPDDPTGPGGPTRRNVLRALALAPAALAGCASAGAGAARGAGGAPERAAVPAVSPEAVAAIRKVELPADAEPASLFRAAASRPGGPR